MLENFVHPFLCARSICNAIFSRLIPKEKRKQTNIRVNQKIFTHGNILSEKMGQQRLSILSKTDLSTHLFFSYHSNNSSKVPSFHFSSSALVIHVGLDVFMKEGMFSCIPRSYLINKNKICFINIAQPK